MYQQNKGENSCQKSLLTHISSYFTENISGVQINTAKVDLFPDQDEPAVPQARDMQGPIFGEIARFLKDWFLITSTNIWGFFMLK